MMPFINPNYYQQYQIPTQPVTMQNVKYVNNFAEIGANDVCMNGGYSIFAKNDMSEIQARCWQPNGTISIIEYEAKNKPIKALENEKPNTLSKEELKCENEAILGQIKVLQNDVTRILNKLNGNGGKKNESTGNT